MSGRLALALSLAGALALAGCDSFPGRPHAGTHDVAPTQIVAFDVLYTRHCAGCHGTDGRLGAARPLNDPVYLAIVPRERLREVIARGVRGTSQPAFAQSAGGDLTDAQIDALVDGVLKTWKGAEALRDVPPYSGAGGDAGRGKTVFASACASCHGAEGAGGPKGGSVVDPSYLALASDQGLRTTVIAGRSDLGMPDWRAYVAGKPLTNEQISDVAAWLTAQRRPVPGRLPAEAVTPGPTR
jgi:mono/diheme cytochrome c family protein